MTYYKKLIFKFLLINSCFFNITYANDAIQKRKNLGWSVFLLGAAGLINPTMAKTDQRFKECVNQTASDVAGLAHQKMLEHPKTTGILIGATVVGVSKAIGNSSGTSASTGASCGFISVLLLRHRAKAQDLLCSAKKVDEQSQGQLKKAKSGVIRSEDRFKNACKDERFAQRQFKSALNNNKKMKECFREVKQIKKSADDLRINTNLHSMDISTALEISVGTKKLSKRVKNKAKELSNKAVLNPTSTQVVSTGGTASYD